MAPGCCVNVQTPTNNRVLRILQESERVVVAGTPLLEIGDAGNIEIVVDLVSPGWHRLARDAKDMAAAAVLLASLGALATGAWIFLPRLLTRLLPAG